MAAPVRGRRNKYGAIPTFVNGIRFASKLEAARYRELLARQSAGRISRLERQCSYPVYWPGLEGKKSGLFFTYVCDFRYINNDTGEEVVEDVKGRVLNEFRVKAKGVKFSYGITVHIVTRKRTTWFFDKVPEGKNYA
jgi:hypothetical protein